MSDHSYLIHTDEAPWQVNSGGVNEYVYNTEAHPFKVSCRLFHLLRLVGVSCSNVKQVAGTSV